MARNIIHNTQISASPQFDNEITLIQERKSTPAWERDQERVIDQIRINWDLEKEFSEDDVFRVEGILDVNTIEYFPVPKELKKNDGML